jgi:carbon-monoxide dehydrogenase large subunit
MKSGIPREDALVLWAARRLGRPVKWSCDRQEAFLADEHARDICVDAALGLDTSQRFTALLVSYRMNIGAYMTARSAPAVMNFGGIAGVYTIQHIAGEAIGVLTNTHSTAPYRGAGRPEATYAIERVIDVAAFDLGIDPFQLRYRNLIKPESMPYDTGFIFTYDYGNFGANMEKAADISGYGAFARWRDESRNCGLLPGIGIASCIEVAAGPFHPLGRDSATARMHRDGTTARQGLPFPAARSCRALRS